MSLSSVMINDTTFPVLFIHDVSMIQEAQKRYSIKVKTLRVETNIPILQDSMFTPDVVMVAFFSDDVLHITDRMRAPVCLLEKKMARTKLLEAYHYNGHGYSKEAQFTHTLNGFLGCRSFLNLGFYLLNMLVGIETSSIYTIYFVDKTYLDSDKEDNESCDTSLEKFFKQE